MKGALTPLAYHLEIAARLEALEPRGWALFTSAARQDPATAAETASGSGDVPGDDLEQQLLRHAYRMELKAHPKIHTAARRAADALGLTVPISIYQLESMEQANAALAFRRDEAVIALSGNLLALLTDEELVACFGHELAHHRLWTADDGRVLVADRFLGALTIDAATPPYYLETGRRFDLATELFADRGSLLASGSLEVTVTSLVKVATGLTEVDPASFLRQARDARLDRGADGTSHPETVLRAWALERWQAGDGDAATSTLLGRSLDIERLDLLDRERLDAMTRRLVHDVLAPEWIRTDAVIGHARQFMVDITPGVAASGGWFRGAGTGQSAHAPPEAVATRVPDDAPTETRRYLSYVLLDLATVDADLADESLVECLAVAREAGFEETFEEVARKELTMNGRAWDAARRRSEGRRHAAPSPDLRSAAHVQPDETREPATAVADGPLLDPEIDPASAVDSEPDR
jgi:hypothetical protein